MLQATHQGVLPIGTVSIPCFVLQDGTRLVSALGLSKSLGVSDKTVIRKNGQFLNRICRNPLSGNGETIRNFAPIRFARPDGGKEAHGFSASTVTHIVRSVLMAREAGLLKGGVELRVAAQCQILLLGFAEVGLAALIDKHTGYTPVQEKDGLQAIFDRFLAKEATRWTKRFPDEFYKQLARLRGWPYSKATTKRPGCVALMTNDLIYDRLAPGILDELRKKTPQDEHGRRADRFHQWLSSDCGEPRLKAQIDVVVALMKISSNWNAFLIRVDQVLPKLNETAVLPFNADDFE